MTDALVDFTGGVCQLLSLESNAGVKTYSDNDDLRAELFTKLSDEVRNQSLVCCAVRSREHGGQERTNCGLVTGFYRTSYVTFVIFKYCVKVNPML